MKSIMISNVYYIYVPMADIANTYVHKLGECIALWGEPNELSIQHHIYKLDKLRY